LGLAGLDADSDIEIYFGINTNIILAPLSVVDLMSDLQGAVLDRGRRQQALSNAYQ
jgi:hypothetical protein